LTGVPSQSCLSALLFGATHLTNPHATPVGTIAVAIDGGIMLAGLFMLTRSVWPCVGLHWAWNLFEGPVFGLPDSGATGPSLLTAAVTGPHLLTGGVFGPEAGLVAVIVTGAAGAAMLVAAERRGQLRPSPLPSRLGFAGAGWRPR
jgi:hypothetical protein